jgi:hypothetical protein
MKQNMHNPECRITIKGRSINDSIWEAIIRMNLPLRRKISTVTFFDIFEEIDNNIKDNYK